MSGEERFVDEVIRTLRISERLNAMIPVIRQVADQLGGLLELDPDLRPELEVAEGYMGEAAMALSRLAEFATARIEVALERLDEEE